MKWKTPRKNAQRSSQMRWKKEIGYKKFWRLKFKLSTGMEELHHRY